MDRRTALAGLLAIAGAGASCRARVTEILFNTTNTKTAAAASPKVRRTDVPGFKAVTTSPIPIGGGGFVTGIDLSADGQRFVCRTDVANAYVRGLNEAAWRPLFSQATLQTRDYDPPLPALSKGDGEGVAGIRMAPSDPDTIYASYRGYVWISRDGGRSIRRTQLPQRRMFSNTGRQRLYNRTIDVHPHDPRVAIVGTWGEGVWYTVNAGHSWKAIDVPESGRSRDDQPGVYLVLIDPLDPNRVHVFVSGVGLFSAASGVAGAFVRSTGGPTHSSSMIVDSAGRVCLCETTTSSQGGAFWRYAPKEGWSRTALEREALVAALDPHRDGRLILIDPDGYFMETLDGGATVQKVGGGKYVAGGGEVRWMGGLVTIYPAQAAFDPKDSDLLWVAQGVGVAKVTPSGSKYPIEDWSAGIEELCAVSALCVPGGKAFLTSWDKPFWRVDSTNSYTNDFRYPVTPGHPREANFVGFASNVDFAPGDANFLVGIVVPTDRSAPGYTSDGGAKWQAFEGAPTTGWGYGGCIAASTRENFVLLPSNNAAGAFTLDGGKTWEALTLDGVRPTDRFSNAFYVNRKNVTADKTRPGTFALVYTVIHKDAAGHDVPGNLLGGVWLTTNGGRQWSQMLKGVISSGNHDPRAVEAEGVEARQFWQCQLEYVPGRSGELVYSPHADGNRDPFFWSHDDGATWSELHRSVKNVSAFAFGKTMSGQARPAVFFWGDVKGVKGLYASFDWFATMPLLISRFPSPMLLPVSCLAGDLDRFGRAIVGTSCGGWISVEVEV